MYPREQRLNYKMRVRRWVVAFVSRGLSRLPVDCNNFNLTKLELVKPLDRRDRPHFREHLGPMARVTRTSAHSPYEVRHITWVDG